MTYYESAEDEMITQARALKEIADHGLADEIGPSSTTWATTSSTLRRMSCGGLDTKPATLWMRPRRGVSMASRQKCKCTKPQLGDTP
jgi:hypothetical protein